MANVISMKQLLEAGVHFGHQTRRWNPKMAEYIFTERNGIYIIDLQKTVKKVEEAYYFVRDIAASGEDILFVGTKKQAQDSIKEEAERVGMYYVNARWLGGMLTNFKTIQKAEDFTIQKEELSFVRWYKIEEVIRLIEVGSKEIVFKKDEIRLFKKLLEVTKKDEKESFFLKIKKLLEVN